MLKLLEYRPDVDGLRAIAVLSVLLYHLGVTAPGGYVGVDIFFVISGYLITSIIINSISNESFSFLEFMERRIRRIFPPMLLVIVVTLIVAYFLQLPSDFKQTAFSAIAQIFSLSNIFFYLETGGYFRAQAEIIPLLHTWSLSVEEQFYFVVPLVLLGLHKYARRKASIVFIFGVTSSLILSIIGLEYFKTANFYLLPTRAWELGLGALLPVLTLNKKATKSRVLNELISIIGLTAIFYSIFLYDSSTPFPGQYAILPCVGTIMLIWANQSRNTMAYHVLSNKVFVGVGLISYSVYLWHWPLIAFSNYVFLDLARLSTQMMIALASVSLGYLSWKYVENPLRKTTRINGPKIFQYWAISSIAVTFAGVVIMFQDGFVHRFSPEVLSLSGESTVRTPGLRISLEQTRINEFHQIGNSDIAGDVEVFFWGDSHAQSALESFDRFLRDRGVKGEAAVYPGVLPVLDSPSIYPGSLGKSASEWNRNILEYIQKTNVRTVVMVAAWNRNLRDNTAPKRIYNGLQKVVIALNSKDIDLYILAQVPENDHSYPREAAFRQWRRGNINGVGPTRTEYSTTPQNRLFSNISGDFTILDPTDIFYPERNEQQLIAINYKSLYFDKDHLNSFGSNFLSELYNQIFIVE